VIELTAAMYNWHKYLSLSIPSYFCFTLFLLLLLNHFILRQNSSEGLSGNRKIRVRFRALIQYETPLLDFNVWIYSFSFFCYANSIGISSRLNFYRYRSQIRIKRRTFTTSEACGKNFQVLLDVESNWAILKKKRRT